MLHTIEHYAEIPVGCRKGVVSIGNFDGVHRGHLVLLKSLCRLARDLGGPAVVFTFDPHPVNLLRPAEAPVPLTWTERKSELLHAYGVDQVLVLKTTGELLQLTAQEFFDRVIREGLQARALVEGPNFGFGRDRAGSIATLNRLCAASGVQLDVLDPVELGGQIVSSSRVRDSLAEGDVDTARRLLGRPHRVRGQVRPGAGRGAGIGFPTANLFDVEGFVPGGGVYACRAVSGGESWPAATHVGQNLTFGQTEQSIEAHLIGFSGNLVHQTLELDLLARLRGTQQFSSPAELVDQIRRDVEQAGKIAAQYQPQP